MLRNSYVMVYCFKILMAHFHTEYANKFVRGNEGKLEKPHDLDRSSLQGDKNKCRNP